MIRSQPVRKASFFVSRIAPVVFFTAALAITPAVPAFAEGGVYSGAPISLELVDADLQQLLTAFSEMTDFVFAVDAQTVEKGGLDHLVTVDYKSIPWDQVLDLILRISGFDCSHQGNRIEVFQVSDTKGMQLMATSGI